MFSFIDQCEDQLLNKHSVPLLDIVVVFSFPKMLVRSSMTTNGTGSEFS